MQYAYLGRTGVKVSVVCLGTMTFGKEADEATSAALMDHAFETGVNFFDTANIYNQGVSEEIIGRWMGARRDAIVLASKVHFPTGDGVNDRGSSRRHIMLSVEQSLGRLKTDRLDLLYLHHWDADTALDESLAALTTLVEQGKILYCGVSNFSAWQTVKANATAAARGYAPVVCIQPMYNLVKRQAEVEILPMALEEGLGVCPYSPMGAGLLSGKYERGEEGRLKQNEMYKKRYKQGEYWSATEAFVKYARQSGDSPAALAVAWVVHHPAVTSAIVGARNIEQLSESMKCVEVDMGADRRAEITALSPAPPPATDRTESMA